MSDAIAFLRGLAEDMKTQDNAMTSLPIYTVQEHVLMTGLDADFADEVVWICDGDVVGDEAGDYGDMTSTKLEEMHANGEEIPEGYFRTGAAMQWFMREAFFTRFAAEQYIATQAHRHSGQLRMYVESAHRNPQLRELRRLLSGPVLECVEALAALSGRPDEYAYMVRAKAALLNLDKARDPFQ